MFEKKAGIALSSKILNAILNLHLKMYHFLKYQENKHNFLNKKLTF